MDKQVVNECNHPISGNKKPASFKLRGILFLTAETEILREIDLRKNLRKIMHVNYKLRTWGFFMLEKSSFLTLASHGEVIDRNLILK